LIVDQKVLNEFAQTKPEDDSMEDVSAYTPLQMDADRGISTPVNNLTPIYNPGGYTAYPTPGYTPVYDGGMSPGPGNAYSGSSVHMMSPGYQMTSTG
jgi:hypothetical protein